MIELAQHLDRLGHPLCPCRFYPEKTEEIKHRTWVCPCEDMHIYKYSHRLLFVTEEGLPITEHLTEEHEEPHIYGLVKDPTPDKERAMRNKDAEREEECRNRLS